MKKNLKNKKNSTIEIEEKAREIVLNIKNFSSIAERKKSESLKNFLGIGKKT